MAELKFLQLKLKYASFQGGFRGHDKIKLRQLIVNFIFFLVEYEAKHLQSIVDEKEMNLMFTVLDTTLLRQHSSGRIFKSHSLSS